VATYSDLRDIINTMLYEDNTDDSAHEDAVIAAAEIKHIVGIFKIFFDRHYANEKFRKNNIILINLATIFCDEDDFMGEYNKVCYLIKQNIPAAVGEGKDVLRAPEPFKSQIFDD
jgi:hypothetical protein